jgi:hypothetical protein
LDDKLLEYASVNAKGTKARDSTTSIKRWMGQMLESGAAARDYEG